MAPKLGFSEQPIVEAGTRRTLFTAKKNWIWTVLDVHTFNDTKNYDLLSKRFRKRSANAPLAA